MGRNPYIARVAGEAFDADQITPNCEECGRSEYSCECEEGEEGTDDAPDR